MASSQEQDQTQEAGEAFTDQSPLLIEGQKPDTSLNTLNVPSVEDRRASILEANAVTKDQLLSTASQAILQQQLQEPTTNAGPDGSASFPIPTFLNSALPMIALLLFLGLACFLVGRMGWSILWLLVIGAAIVCFLYRQIGHFNLYHLHHMRREAAKIPLGMQMETTEWINHLLDRLWVVAEPIICARVMDEVNKILKERKFPGIEGIKLDTFTLGSRAPALLGVKVYPEVAENQVHLDMDVAFVPNDTATLDNTDIVTRRRHPGRGAAWDSKIVLVITPGLTKFASFNIPTMVRKITFLGKLRIQMELMPNLPFLKIVEVGFLTMPTIDFDLKPLKGLDLMDIPGLSHTIHGIIHGVLNMLAVNPNRITLNIAELLAGRLRDRLGKSRGVIKIELFGVRGIKTSGSSLFGSAFEPYLRVLVAGQVRIETEQLRKDDPDVLAGTLEWNELHHLLLPGEIDTLLVELMGSSTSLVGRSVIDLEPMLKKVEENNNLNQGGQTIDHEWLKLEDPVTREVVGEVQVSVNYLPLIPEAETMVPTGAIGIGGGEKDNKQDMTLGHSLSSGVISAEVSAARDLPLPGSFLSSSPGDHHVYYEVALMRAGTVPKAETHLAGYDPYLFRSTSHKPEGMSGHGNSVTWPGVAPFEMLIGDPNKDTLSISIKSRKGNVVTGMLREDALIGHWNIPVNQLLTESGGAMNDWVTLATSERNKTGTKAKIHVQLRFRPLLEKQILSLDAAQSAHVPAVAALRLRIVSVSGVNRHGLMGSVTGPTLYKVAVAVSGRMTGATLTYPATGADDGGGTGAMAFVHWNETMWPLIKGPKDRVILTLMTGGGGIIGTIELPLSDYAAHPGQEYAKMLPLALKSAESKSMQITFLATYYPVIDEKTLATDDANVTSNLGIVDLDSIYLKGVYGGARKTSVSIDMGTDVHLDPPDLDHHMITNPAPDGTCVWTKPRLERVFLKKAYQPGTSTTKRVCQFVVHVTENRAMQGKKTLVYQSFPLDSSIIGEHMLSIGNGSDLKPTMIIEGRYLTLSGKADPEPIDAGRLSITVHGAAKLIGVDQGNTTSDPYIVVRVNGKECLKTDHVVKSLEPRWFKNNSCVQAIYREPKHRSLLEIEVRDWNRVSSSKTLGTLFMDLNKLKANGGPKEFVDVPLDNVPHGTISFILQYDLDDRLMHEMAMKRRKQLLEGQSLGGAIVGAVPGGALIGAVGGAVGTVGGAAIDVVEGTLGAVGTVGHAGLNALDTVGSAGLNVVGTVGSGVTTGVSKLASGMSDVVTGKVFHRKDKNGKEPMTEETGTNVSSPQAQSSEDAGVPKRRASIGRTLKGIFRRGSGSAGSNSHQNSDQE